MHKHRDVCGPRGWVLKIKLLVAKIPTPTNIKKLIMGLMENIVLYTTMDIKKCSIFFFHLPLYYVCLASTMLDPLLPSKLP